MQEIMKKYMLADFAKELNQYDIDRFMRYYDVSEVELQEVLDIQKQYLILDNQIEQAFQMYYLKREYQVSLDEAECLKDHWHNEADWKLAIETAETLEIDICDVTDDDIEELQTIYDLGGSKGNTYTELTSSLGKAFIYIAKGYFFLAIFNDGNPANYPISQDEAYALYNAESLGTYFNNNMRNSDKYSDLPGSWGCIGPDPDNPKRLMSPQDKAKLPKDLQYLV